MKLPPLSRSTAVSLLLLFALAAVVWWLRGYSGQSTTALPDSWQKLEGCRLVRDHNNDGDSFRVQHGGQVHTFRLYFVDCPEKELRRDNESRLRDQATYFSLPNPEAAAQVGRMAQEYTLQLLNRPFTVQTRWERVYDSRRFYAQVLLRSEDGRDLDLSELLVKNGLARIYTRGAPLPNAISVEKFRRFLRGVESAAKRAGVGAWGR